MIRTGVYSDTKRPKECDFVCFSTGQKNNSMDCFISLQKILTEMTVIHIEKNM
jgi:hypothetical protein